MCYPITNLSFMSIGPHFDCLPLKIAGAKSKPDIFVIISGPACEAVRAIRDYAQRTILTRQGVPQASMIGHMKA